MHLSALVLLLLLDSIQHLLRELVSIVRLVILALILLLNVKLPPLGHPPSLGIVPV
jgi:hypothetical protein